MRHFLTASALLAGLALTACGDKTPDTATAEAPAETQAAETSEPEIGDKIDDTVTAAPNVESDDSGIAARAAAEAAERDALAKRGVQKIGWEDLMPEGEQERLEQMYQSQMAMLYSGAGVAEGSAADQMVQIGTFNTVDGLNETKIRIPGYTVPFEYGAKAEIKEFLLVPYFGACLHAPPPPPNQTVFVMTDEPIKLKDLAQAVWIEGTIYTQTQESELADAAYTIKLDSVEEYEY